MDIRAPGQHGVVAAIGTRSPTATSARPIVLEGISDLGFDPALTAERVIDGLRRAVRRRRPCAVPIAGPAQRPAGQARAYDSGDGLHPSSGGYRRMTQAVDLTEPERPAC